MTQKITTFDLRNIKSTVMFILAIGLFVTGFIYYFFPTKEVLNGVLFGIFVGIFNYVTLVFLITRLIRPGEKKLRVGLLLVLKMLSLFGLVAMGITVFDLNLLAFVAGYLSLILACLLQVALGNF